MSKHDGLIERLERGASYHESEGDLGLPCIMRQAIAAIRELEGALRIVPATIRRRSDLLRNGYELHLTKDQCEIIGAALGREDQSNG